MKRPTGHWEQTWFATICKLISDSLLLKTKQQAPNGVTYAKPHVTKPDITYSFGIFQKWNLKPVNQELLDQQLLGKLPERLLPFSKGK